MNYKRNAQQETRIPLLGASRLRFFFARPLLLFLPLASASCFGGLNS
jgi:hypothetical protein